MRHPVASQSTLDRDDDYIREWYDRIMRGEGVLADIGTRAFSEIIAIGVERDLLDDAPNQITPREIVDVVRLFRLHLYQRNSQERVWFNQLGRELGYRPHELFFRRCVELPRYFEVLQFHRNKRAHRDEVTTASLCALAGVVLGILELSADDWTDTQELKDTAEKALAWASNQDDGLRQDLDQKEKELAQARMKVHELEAKSPQENAVYSSNDPEVVKGALTSAKAHITKKVNEAKDDLERRLEQIGDAVVSLRSEVLDAQKHGQPGVEETDAAAAPSQQRPTLTGAQAKAKLAAAFRRMRVRGVDISANVFQRWVVDEAIEYAAYGKMDQIDDWWKLPIVQGKTTDEKRQMREQLQMPDVENWMMDIYRRVERRSKGA